MSLIPEALPGDALYITDNMVPVHEPRNGRARVLNRDEYRVTEDGRDMHSQYIGVPLE